ncbi:uncharacterized protein LOC128266589 isoform X2 [Drosophila gunungcola]|uniref:uncharacterized protein LOC128266589 isoform X2 n=1 Tax=Drosophila gunungcola TaxID=103775 RepID=UPI0022E6DCCD|nr:uncharacterized protein LOC128266589 isoform X2 [Drosophila gunungcola]
MQRMGVQLKPQFSSRTRAGNLANIQQPASKPTEMNRTSRRLPALLFGLLVCLVAQTAGRPSTEDVSDMAIIPPDADNVEIHQVKFVNGVMQEDHPVIMYKEDFVSEDYDPTKNETSSGRYKKHKRTHHHRAETQLENEGERILFDVLPDKPIVLSDDLKTLPVSKMEAAQLAEPIKLGKLPKKYHSRQRRDLHNKHQKVIPVYLYNFYPVEKNFLTYRPPVSNKKPKLTEKKNRRYKPTNYLKPDQSDGQNPDDVNTRGEFDLIHDSDPKNADHSVYNQSTTSKTPLFSIMDSAPVGGPIFGVQVPDNDDRGAPNFGSSAGAPAPTQRPGARPANPPPTSAPKVSNCVWAILNCCSSDSEKIRYNCFEEFNCHGAFWDINPCADREIRDADLVPLAGFSPPGFAPPPASASRPIARRPSFREDSIRFPQEIGYQAGSNCQRASKYCCGLRNYGSQYDCFQHYDCHESLAAIISSCS